mgnify:FL=1
MKKSAKQMFKLNKMEGYRRPDPWENFKIKCEETEILNRTEFSIQNEYELSATLSTRFFANPAQYSMALENAQKFLLNKLYSDIITELNMIKKATMDRDEKAIFDACERIHQKIGL